MNNRQDAVDGKQVKVNKKVIFYVPLFSEFCQLFTAFLIFSLFTVYYLLFAIASLACECEKHVENSRQNTVGSKQELDKDSSLSTVYHLLSTKKDPQVIYPEEYKDKKFVGAEKCKLCHSREYRKWQNTKHAKAYEDMEKHSRQNTVDSIQGIKDKGQNAVRSIQVLNKTHTGGNDSSLSAAYRILSTINDCQPCHTTGFGYKFGFIDKQISNNLTSVQCEVCHGAGEEHIKKPKQIKMVYGSNPITETLCRSCHDKEISAKFEFGEYVEKIKCNR